MSTCCSSQGLLRLKSRLGLLPGASGEKNASKLFRLLTGVRGCGHRIEVSVFLLTVSWGPFSAPRGVPGLCPGPLHPSLSRLETLSHENLSDLPFCLFRACGIRSDPPGRSPCLTVHCSRNLPTSAKLLLPVKVDKISGLDAAHIHSPRGHGARLGTGPHPSSLRHARAHALLVLLPHRCSCWSPWLRSPTTVSIFKNIRTP